jgi:hypothetical protein
MQIIARTPFTHTPIVVAQQAHGDAISRGQGQRDNRRMGEQNTSSHCHVETKAQ